MQAMGHPFKHSETQDARRLSAECRHFFGASRTFIVRFHVLTSPADWETDHFTPGRTAASQSIGDNDSF